MVRGVCRSVSRTPRRREEGGALGGGGGGGHALGGGGGERERGEIERLLAEREERAREVEGLQDTIRIKDKILQDQQDSLDKCKEQVCWRMRTITDVNTKSGLTTVFRRRSTCSVYLLD